MAENTSETPVFVSENHGGEAGGAPEPRVASRKDLVTIGAKSAIYPFSEAERKKLVSLVNETAVNARGGRLRLRAIETATRMERVNLQQAALALEAEKQDRSAQLPPLPVPPPPVNVNVSVVQQQLTNEISMSAEEFAKLAPQEKVRVYQQMLREPTSQSKEPAKP